MKKERKNDKIIDNKTKLKYITIDQFNKFIEYVPEDWKAFYIFAMYTGCRKGEIVALTWNDIDFDNKVININKTLYSKIKDKTGDKVVVNSTKNNQNRSIQMSSYLYDVLLEHKQKATKYREYFGEKGGITLSGGEPLLQPDFAYEIFKLCHENGINTCLDTSGMSTLAPCSHQNGCRQASCCRR